MLLNSSILVARIALENSCAVWQKKFFKHIFIVHVQKLLFHLVYVYVCIYIYKFSQRGFSEPVYKYLQGQTVEGLRKSARAAHISRRNLQSIRSALSERNRDRPQHRDHDPTLCEKCVGSFKSLHRRIERLDLWFNVLIR